jgi:hypothetical protein
MEYKIAGTLHIPAYRDQTMEQLADLVAAIINTR